MTGLTSVTFRNLSGDEIIKLALQGGLDGIEWGGDIHVPPGNPDYARETGDKTRKAGLEVLSYGSYFRLCAQDDAREAFLPVLESAKALGAPNIRIWAGKLPPQKADEAYYQRAAHELKQVCSLASEQGLLVSLEYHRGTLTETSGSALKLLKAANGPNLKTYWQPNPDISHEENARELTEILPYLSNIHVFHWTPNTRHALKEGLEVWRRYVKSISLAAGKGTATENHYILEFVKDDVPQQFLEDANFLLKLLGGTI